jgi:hypothetical protein
MSSQSSGISETSSGSCHLHNRDFKIIIDMKTGCPQMVVHLVAPTIQEKAAWISDISQVLHNYLISNYIFLRKETVWFFSIVPYLPCPHLMHKFCFHADACHQDKMQTFDLCTFILRTSNNIKIFIVILYSAAFTFLLTIELLAYPRGS